VLPGGLGDSVPVCCITPYSKGFVAGSGSGALRIYERSDEVHESYRCLKVSGSARCATAYSITTSTVICTVALSVW
jgi:hypothetical protein